MRRALDIACDIAAGAAGFFVFAIFVLMVGSSAMRELGLRTGGTDDIVAWCCAASAFLAMAQAFRRGDFVRVSLLLESLPPRPRHVAETVALAIATAFTGYLAYWAVRFTFDSWRFNDMAQGLAVIPMWIPQTGFAAGCVLLFLAVAAELASVWAGARPSYVTAVEDRHARGDYTEDV